MLTLRPYQQTIIEQIRAQWHRSRILVVSPTGSGKTSLTAHIIKNATARGKRCWFLNHRRELVRQSVTTLEDSAGVNCGIIAAGFGSNGYHLVQVASIQTLMKRWGKYPLPDLIIVDECHHAVSASWSKLLTDIVARKPDVKIIGLTATPQRLDGRGLAAWFEVMVEGPNTAQLMEQGFLSKYRMWGASLPDLTGVHSIGGDYNKGELDAALSRTAVVGDALGEYKKHCDGMRALAFTWSVKSSEELASRFNEAGIPAMHVDGETDSAVRDRAIRDFHAGRIKLLSNVELFSEGLDVHGIQAEFLLRPTQSLAMYLQQVGRGLRTDDGKDCLRIFDHAGHMVTHGYPDDLRTWTLDGMEVKPKKPYKVPIRQCPKCYATVSLSTRVCKWCGTTFTIKERKIEREEGELVELDMASMERLLQAKTRKIEQGRAASYDDLLEIEKQRGYKPGWAKHIAAAREAKRRKSQLTLLADSFRP